MIEDKPEMIQEASMIEDLIMDICRIFGNFIC